MLLDAAYIVFTSFINFSLTSLFIYDTMNYDYMFTFSIILSILNLNDLRSGYS